MFSCCVSYIKLTTSGILSHEKDDNEFMFTIYKERETIKIGYSILFILLSNFLYLQMKNIKNLWDGKLSKKILIVRNKHLVKLDYSKNEITLSAKK